MYDSIQEICKIVITIAGTGLVVFFLFCYYWLFIDLYAQKKMKG
jgi:hypothetical protein